MSQAPIVESGLCMGQNETFWRTNSSISPPLSRRWAHRFQCEGLSYGSNGDGVFAIYASSLSSNSKESRSWMSGEQVPDHLYSASDGAISYFSSPPNSFQNQQLMQPPVQGANIDEYVRESLSEPQTFSQFAKGTSRVPDSVGSVSSRSEDSEYESTYKSHARSYRSFSSCCSFMSKPMHPLSFPDHAGQGEEAHGSVATTNSDNGLHYNLKSIQALTMLRSHGLLDLGGTSRRETAQWSSTSSIDFTDASGPLEPECFGLSRKNLYEGSRCGLCETLTDISVGFSPNGFEWRHAYLWTQSDS